MEEGISLKEIILILIKYKWKILIINIGLVIIAFIVTFSIRPTYKSSASLLFDIESNNTLQSNNNGSILIKTIDTYTKTNYVKENIIEDLNLNVSLKEYDKKYRFDTQIIDYIINFSITTNEKEIGEVILTKILNEINNKIDYFKSIYSSNVSLNRIDLLEKPYLEDIYYKPSRLLLFNVICISSGILLQLLIVLYSLFNRYYDTIDKLERNLGTYKYYLMSKLNYVELNNCILKSNDINLYGYCTINNYNYFLSIINNNLLFDYSNENCLKKNNSNVFINPINSLPTIQNEYTIVLINHTMLDKDVLLNIKRNINKDFSIIIII